MKKISGVVMLLFVFFLVTIPVVAESLERSNTSEMSVMTMLDKNVFNNTDTYLSTIIVAESISLVMSETKIRDKEEVAIVVFYCENIAVLSSSTKPKRAITNLRSMNNTVKNTAMKGFVSSLV